ncbi:hypothetical protein Ancab_002608 [Ancistrocladus abbreviatus]
MPGGRAGEMARRNLGMEAFLEKEAEDRRRNGCGSHASDSTSSIEACFSNGSGDVVGQIRMCGAVQGRYRSTSDATRNGSLETDVNEDHTLRVAVIPHYCNGLQWEE